LTDISRHGFELSRADTNLIVIFGTLHCQLQKEYLWIFYLESVEENDVA
jgi:hypothetical protein